MRKFWLVAQETYRRRTLAKGFVLAVLVLPAVLALIIGLGAIAIKGEEDSRPVGYVDNSGFLAHPIAPFVGKDEQPLTMSPFTNEVQTQAALTAGRIQAYYILAADYVTSRRIELVYQKTPSGAAASQFRSFLQANLLAGQPQAIAQRAAADANITFRLPDGSRAFPASPTLGQMLPFFLVIFMFVLFFVMVLASPGQPMLAVVEEKENRTLEILSTSLSPNLLIGGKIVAIVAITLTLALAWMALAGLAAFVAIQVFGAAWLQDMHLEPAFVLVMIVLYALAYVTISSLLTAVGATVAEAREGQQVSFIFMLPMMLPFYVLQPIIEQPDGPIAIVLSLFPLTAPAVMPLLILTYPVPAWQIALSIGILVFTALGSIWLAGRALRLGMLRYGQPLRWSEILPWGRRPVVGGRR
jgi:ABC-2 type transport system permease protein